MSASTAVICFANFIASLKITTVEWTLSV